MFADGTYGSGWNLTESSSTDGHGVTGLLGIGDAYDAGLGARQLLMQAIACVVLIVVGRRAVLSPSSRSRTPSPRAASGPSEEDELAGLDLPEMGVQAYPEFAGALGSYGSGDGGSVVKTPVHT